MDSLPSTKHEKTHQVPAMAKTNAAKGDKPLCTLFITFSDLDQPDRQVTTAHVFAADDQRCFPQTRRTVYTRHVSTRCSRSQMSLASPPFIEDDYERLRLGSLANTKTSSTLSSPSRYYDNHIVQEVSLSYSAPYSVAMRPNEPLAVHISSGNSIEDYSRAFNDNVNPYAYYSDHESRRRVSPAKRFEPYERFYPLGKNEGDYSVQNSPYSYTVKRYGVEDIPYFSANSAVQSAHNTPIHTPRATSAIGNSISTVRVPSASSQNTIISKSTTIEELTTITTTNTQSKKENNMPTVNAIAQQFEASTRRDRKDAHRPKPAPSKEPRVVVINRQNQYSPTYSNGVRHAEQTAYYPAEQRGIVTTTIVDIDPPGYGRRTRIEEYKIEEEYRSTKTYGQPPTRPAEQRRTREEEVEIFVRSQSRSDKRSQEPPPTDSQISPTVRNVIEHFEHRIDERSKTSSENKENALRETMAPSARTVTTQEITEKKEYYTPKRELDDDLGTYGTTWKPRPTAVPPPTPQKRTQPDFIRTYEEERTMVVRQDGTTGTETKISMSQPPPMTVDFGRKEPHEKEPEPAPEPEFAPTPADVRREEQVHVSREDVLIEETTQKIEKKGEPEKPAEEEKPLEASDTDDSSRVSRTTDRDIRLRSIEEVLTSIQRRERSEPPYRSAYRENSRGRDPTMQSGSYQRTTSSVESNSSNVATRGFGKKTSSETYIGDAYGMRSGQSGRLSGGICTVAIRDSREREKREIGILNDRLASYIENVRFLEAQNRVLQHDIEILRGGFSADNAQVSYLFDGELKAAKRAAEEISGASSRFKGDITTFTTEIETFRSKWQEIHSKRKGMRGDLDTDLEKLAHIEAEINLVKRRIQIVEEQAIHIKRENSRILADIARVKSQRDQEVSIRFEYQARLQDMVSRVKHFAADNETKIQQELVYIRRDTTPENRDYFRHELQAAIRDIRAEYEAISYRTRTDVESWYSRHVERIYSEASSHHYDHSHAREEITRIRTTLNEMRSRLAELESRNLLLEKQIQDLTFQSTEDNKLYEASLAEKDAALQRMRQQCTELTVEMEKLCDHQISLHVEIEHYRKLLEGASVTVSTASTYLPSHSVVRSSSSSRYVGGNVGGYTSGVSVGGNVGGYSSSISVGGNVGSYSGGAIVGGNIGYSGATSGRSVGGHVGVASSVSNLASATPSTRPDRIHDETGTNSRHQTYQRWYKGTISVKSVQPEYIELENICIIRRVDIGGFTVVHSINGVDKASYTFHGEHVLAPKQLVRIYARGVDPNAEFTMDIDHFDDTPNSRTSAFNADNEEKAWFVFTE